MTLLDYQKQFDAILNGENREYPYDSDAYVGYVKMNRSRIDRWNKRGKMLPSLLEKIRQIEQPQKWLLITEPWCGDAAHSQSFITKLVEENPDIELSMQNRDSSDSEIENYLTNGARSIPMLVVRDANGEDLFSWGPRPKEAQDMVMAHKENTEMSAQEKQIELQKWYNKDKGQSMQLELLKLLESHH
ncbi:MAG: thioredoxin family protein [Bacteroidota bacterium]